jgi:hypothetical protein
MELAGKLVRRIAICRSGGYEKEGKCESAE